MEAFEVMTSESQERMLAIVEPSSLDTVLEICKRWEVTAAMIGRVTEGGSLRILDGFDGEVLADIPASSLHDAAPMYDRPMAEPADLATFRANSANDAPAPDDVAADLGAMLADPSWVSSQYDHQLFLNTVVGPGGDATVLRLKHPTTGADTGRGLAMTTDGNHRWCAVDPRIGTARVVVESLMNLACVGARPVALVNCLNFGNPEHPEVMWQLSEAIDGMGDACRALGIPVIGGNVSLYNESRGANIDPSPVIGLLGQVDDLARRPPGLAWNDGDRLVVLGASDPSLDGSRWAFDHGHRSGSLDPIDYEAVVAIAALVRYLVADDLLTAAHDLGEGGLGVAVAEMAIASGVGATVARVPDHRALFGEAAGRVIVSASADDLATVVERAEAAGVPAARVGLATGSKISIKGLLDADLADLAATWRNRLPDALGGGTVQGLAEGSGTA